MTKKKKDKKKPKIERSYEATMGHDRVSYSEGVKVAIGDYESRDIHSSMSTDVRENEKPKEALSRSRKVVQHLLKFGEKRIREASEEDVDFETLERLNYYK